MNKSAGRIVSVLLLGGFLMCGPAVAKDPKEYSPAEIETLGARMYRDGILPSGEPIPAFTAGDVAVEGTAFTCVSCHLRSGMGSIEGEVITPPTNGRIIYQPRASHIKGFEFVPSYSNYAKYLATRPAYTDRTLADLIASGIDPTGRSVLNVMPRYEIGDDDMALLIAYLKTLSDQLPPGVTADQIRFATVIVESVDPVKVESMLQPLEFNIQRKNSLAAAAEKNDRVARMAYNMLGPDLLKKRFSLAKWILKGPPETWRDQLEAYYAAEPVFALLGGISDGEWEPVHRFCEDLRLPCLMPIVDYPVISETDWYTLYLSRGVRQEGEAAARYIRSLRSLLEGQVILQVYRDNRRGESLVAGFRDILTSSGDSRMVEVRLSADEELTAERLSQLLTEHRPAALLLWDDSYGFDAIQGLASGPMWPAVAIGSGDWLGDRIWDIPEGLREKLLITYPYRLPHQDKRFDLSIQRVVAGRPLAGFDPKVVRQAYASQELLGMALMEMRAEYFRDFFFDTIGMMEDQYFPLYERLSFGPGQRYASKGCYIARVGKGAQSILEPVSEWVTP